MRKHYASGTWIVDRGREDEFVRRWQDWLSRTTRDLSGFGSATLLREAVDPRRFLSVSDWDDAGTRDMWKGSPEFAVGLAACRELCEEFRGADYSAVAQVANEPMQSAR